MAQMNVLVQLKFHLLTNFTDCKKTNCIQCKEFC